MIRPYEHPDREYVRLMEVGDVELEREERVERDARHRPLDGDHVWLRALESPSSTEASP